MEHGIGRKPSGTVVAEKDTHDLEDPNYMLSKMVSLQRVAQRVVVEGENLKPHILG